MTQQTARPLRHPVAAVEETFLFITKELSCATLSWQMLKDVTLSLFKDSSTVKGMKAEIEVWTVAGVRLESVLPSRKVDEASLVGSLVEDRAKVICQLTLIPLYRCHHHLLLPLRNGGHLTTLDNRDPSLRPRIMIVIHSLVLMVHQSFAVCVRQLYVVSLTVNFIPKSRCRENKENMGLTTMIKRNQAPPVVSFRVYFETQIQTHFSSISKEVNRCKVSQIFNNKNLFFVDQLRVVAWVVVIVVLTRLRFQNNTTKIKVLFLGDKDILCRPNFMTLQRHHVVSVMIFTEHFLPPFTRTRENL
jgi:hypothetical protein